MTGELYSHAIIHNGIIYVSGVRAVDLQTYEPKLDFVKDEANLAMTNLHVILEESGSYLDKVLAIAVYLEDMHAYARFNEIYINLTILYLPVRTSIQAGELPFSPGFSQHHL